MTASPRSRRTSGQGDRGEAVVTSTFGIWEFGERGKDWAAWDNGLWLSDWWPGVNLKHGVEARFPLWMSHAATPLRLVHRRGCGTY